MEKQRDPKDYSETELKAMIFDRQQTIQRLNKECEALYSQLQQNLKEESQDESSKEQSDKESN